MKVVAPGKLVLTGAYAVLEGAPAVAVAVSRYAVLDADSPEPTVDVRQLHDDAGRKLGLGSSAAAAVASTAADALARGLDVGAASVREHIFRGARERHAREQGGGSGVDVAASLYGGMIRYTVGDPPAVAPVSPPRGLSVRAYFSGASARTSDLLSRVERSRRRPAVEAAMRGLRELAARAAGAVDSGRTLDFVHAAAAFGAALAALGAASDAPIVLPSFSEAASLAEAEGAAFLPSGAGGGDVGVWLGPSAPSESFDERLRGLSLVPIALTIDFAGVRLSP